MTAKGSKYRFPVQKDFQKMSRKFAASLNEFRNRWCKQEHVECDALKVGSCPNDENFVHFFVLFRVVFK